MEEYYQGRWDKQKMVAYCWTIERKLNNIENDGQSWKRKILTVVLMFTKVLFLLLAYWIIWWKYLLVLVYSILLLLKIENLLVIAEIEFLNEETNICWLKYELGGFYYFTLRNIAIGPYDVYRRQLKKCLFPTQNEVFLYNRNGCQPRKLKGIFRFSAVKLGEKMFSGSTLFHFISCWPV